MREDKEHRVQGRSISMYPEDWELVEARARQLKVGVSTVVRMMVRDVLSPPQQERVERHDEIRVGHAAPAGCDQ